MNAVLTEPGVCRSALWGLVSFGFDFQELGFPDLGMLASIFAREPMGTLLSIVFLLRFSGLSGRFLPFWP